MNINIFNKDLENEFANRFLGERLPIDISHKETGEIIVPYKKIITIGMIRKMVKYYQSLDVYPSLIKRITEECIHRVEYKHKLK